MHKVFLPQNLFKHMVYIVKWSKLGLDIKSTWLGLGGEKKLEKIDI